MECSRCKKEVKVCWVDDNFKEVCGECYKKEGEKNVSKENQK